MLSLWREFGCPENHSSFFPLQRPCWAQNCQLVHSKSERHEQGEKAAVHASMTGENEGIFVFTQRSEHWKAGYPRHQAGITSMRQCLWCSFKLDESSLIIRAGPLNAVGFFPIAVFLVEPQSSKLPQTESLSSWHSFGVSLGGVNRCDRFKSLFSFTLICDKCVPGCHGFMALIIWFK